MQKDDAMNLSPYEFGELLAGFHNAARPAPASADSGVTNMLTQILKETRIMSDTQTQVARDVAQMVADIAVIKPAFQTMVDKIAALTKTAATETVPPELQAQIYELHAFAQSVAPAPVAVTPSEPTAATLIAPTTSEPVPVETPVPAEPVGTL